MAKILFLDIETAPITAHTWSLWPKFISHEQMQSPTYILSFAWSWSNSSKVYGINLKQARNEKNLLRALVKQLDNADIVVAHNGKKFDIKKINARLLFHKIAPPSPYRLVDTYLVARKYFSFDSNKLDFLSSILGGPEKNRHAEFEGLALWEAVLKNDSRAWEVLLDYNMDDIPPLRYIYNAMLPWMDDHPNVALISGSKELCCPKCGSTHVQKRGFYFTSVGKYQKFMCSDCGGWGRSRFSEKSDSGVLRNAVGF